MQNRLSPMGNSKHQICRMPLNPLLWLTSRDMSCWVDKGVGMISRRGVLGSLASISAAVVGGCALPVAGPHDWDIASGQYDPKSLLYALVRLTPRTVDILAANNPQIAGEFPDRRGPEAVRFGVGDVLGITIFESGAGGLFTPSQGGATTGNYVTLPNQAVDDRPLGALSRGWSRCAHRREQRVVHLKRFQLRATGAALHQMSFQERGARLGQLSCRQLPQRRVVRTCR